MKYLKITLSIIGLLAFSQSYAQAVDAKVEKRFNKADVNADKSLSLEELTSFFEGKKTKDGRPYNADKVMERKDANEDGVLSLEEFGSKGKNKDKDKKKGKKKN